MEGKNTKLILNTTKKDNVRKLECVKAIKILTGYGLKEAKFVFDDIFEKSMGHISVIDYDMESIQTLQNNGFIIDNNREGNIDDILALFKISNIKFNEEYIIYEGTFEIKENNLLEVNIIEGVKKNHQNFFSDDTKIENKSLYLPFTECLIEKHN
jgi:hypothetical protein